MCVSFSLIYIILFVSDYAGVVLLEYNSSCIEMFILSSVMVIFFQASLLSQCQALTSKCLVQSHYVCNKCLSVSHAFQRMPVPVLLMHLGMRLLKLRLCFCIVAEHIGGLRGWMKAHKLLYVCSKEHALCIMYCEQRNTKSSKVIFLNIINLTLQGHICKILQWVSNAMYVEIITVRCCLPLQSSPLTCLLNRSNYLPMP